MVGGIELAARPHNTFALPPRGGRCRNRHAAHGDCDGFGAFNYAEEIDGRSHGATPQRRLIDAILSAITQPFPPAESFSNRASCSCYSPVGN